MVLNNIRHHSYLFKACMSHPLRILIFIQIFVLFFFYLYTYITCPIQQCIKESSNFRNLKKIYIITPTYNRLVQAPELIRLSQAFSLVPNLHWIIVEDNHEQSEILIRLLRRLSKTNPHPITHLFAKTPPAYKRKPNEPYWKYPKGVWQRNEALKWIRNNLSIQDKAVIYFADDDNTYDRELFKEIRDTNKVSVWPVGLAGGLLVEKPLVRLGRVVGFNSLWKPERPFPIDMAGFAISLSLLITNQNTWFDSKGPVGYIESNFLSQIVQIEDLEPRANNCTRILVWHTRSSIPNLHEERKLTVSSLHGVEFE